MRFHLAWRNLLHNRVRTLVLLSGMGFSILLLFMQVGFYNACKINSTMIYDMFAYDAVLLAPYYVFIDDAGTLPLARAKTALSVPGVAWISPLFLSKARLRHSRTGELNDILTLGVDVRAHAPFKNEALNQNIRVLGTENDVLVDRKANLDYGPLPLGGETELNGHRIRVAGEFRNGAGFISGGALILNDQTFASIYGRSTRSPSVVLLGLAPGADITTVKAALSQKLSGNIQVLTREELRARERYFFMSANPIGIMFSSGAGIAFLVGAVILYQILSTEVIHHLREYATLKAMGYTGNDLKAVVMAQGVLMTAAGFIPAAGLSALLYQFLRNAVQIPVYMTPGLLTFILGASLIMSTVSGLMAVRRIQAADPAELF